MSSNVVLLSGYQLKKDLDNKSNHFDSEEFKKKTRTLLQDVFMHKQLYDFSQEQLEIIDRPISSLSLSIQAIHELELKGVSKFVDLLFFDDDEIILLSNVDEKSLTELLQIKYILDDHFSALLEECLM